MVRMCARMHIFFACMHTFVHVQARTHLWRRIELGSFDEIRGSMSVELWLDPVRYTKGRAFVGRHSHKGSNLFLFGFFSTGYLVRIRKKTLVVRPTPNGGREGGRGS